VCQDRALLVGEVGVHMKHTGRAIRDAAERGGWWKVADLEHNERYNALRMRGLTQHLSDPSFWKALATARERQDTGTWICHWHRFIDHIALGEDAESFFSSL
jgi:hypothetical protein